MDNRITHYKENARIIVRGFSNEQLGSRLMSMGILPGTLLTIEKIALFRGGYCIKTHSGVKLALRYEEANSIFVTENHLS